MRRRATRAATAWALALLFGVAMGEAAAPRVVGAAPPAPVDTLRVEAAVAPAVVRVGERVDVRFAVARPDSAARLIAPPAPMAFGDVDVVESSPAAAGADSLGWKLEVALFSAGDHDLSLIPFALESAAGSRPVRLLPYTISVESALPETLAGTGLRDIAGPVDLPAKWRWAAVILAAVAVVAVAGALIFWVRRPRGAAAPLRAEAPRVPPEVEARRALAALEREALPARGRIKEHYARLSLILRGYMERRTPLAAVESTTEEIRTVLAGGAWFPAPRTAEILTLFDEADLVKFARFDPGPAAADEALARGRGWLDAVAGDAPASAGDAPAVVADGETS
jgi:hypothetical protein